VRHVSVPHHSSLIAHDSRRALALIAAPLVFALACSTARFSTEPGAPSLVLPAHFAEGQGEPGASAAPARSAAPASAAASAGAASSSASAEPAPKPSTLPDPTPLRMAEQVEYELELSDGKVRVVSAKPVKLAEPIVTPRRLGRYAVELVIGHELIDRVRFDFPGTAADDPQIGPKKPLYSPLTLSERAIGHVKLMLPQSQRVRRALLVDRALNTATEIAWPLPNVPQSPPAASGSAAPAAPSHSAAPAAPPRSAAPSHSAPPAAPPRSAAPSHSAPPAAPEPAPKPQP
jgi:hypothetical protein